MNQLHNFITSLLHMSRKGVKRSIDEQTVQRAEKKSRRESRQQLVLEFLSFVCRSTKDIKLKDDKFVESFNQYYHPDVVTKELKDISLADVLRIVFTCELKLPTAYAS